MVSYQEVGIRLTSTQSNKFKCAYRKIRHLQDIEDIIHLSSNIKNNLIRWIFWLLVRKFRIESTNKHCYSFS